MLFRSTLIDPAILLFFFGILAGTLRSNLEIPPAIAKFCSLYLLLVIGFKGGLNLHATGFTAAMGWALLAAFILALAVPAWSFLVLRRRLSPFDAAAVAATYGSVSAVTFITAVSFAEQQGLDAGGYMAVALVLMESPAIIMAVLLANLVRSRAARQATAPAVAVVGGPGGRAPLSLRGVLHEAFTDGAHLLLLGAMAVGYLSGDAGKAVMQPFSGDLFKGMLAFFLLDMGLMVARNFEQARKASPVLIAYAALSPVVHAAIALGLGWTLSLPAADAALLMVLSASASYIVVPAVLRYAIPEANPALYFGLSLGITFPLNIIVGIPAYTEVARAVLG